MNQGTEPAAITVSVDDDAMTARIVIRSTNTPPGEIDVDLDHLVETIAAGGIVVDAGVREELATAIKLFQEQPRHVERVIATATPAIDGVDGCIEWVSGCDPTPAGASNRDVAGNAQHNHYNRIQYIRVEAGAHVGTILPPTDGTPGVDVLGHALPASAGRPCPTRVEEGLDLADDGRIHAVTEGMLQLTHNTLRVTQMMEIGSWVDFSTGNVTFDGSVHIGDGVRDQFEVRVTGSIVVDGVIEASRIECGGDLECRLGMAGRKHGSIHVGGDASFGYLNDVRGVVEGDLIVRREIVNCRLTTHGDVIADSAIAFGGDSVISGNLTLGQLGTERERATTLVVGMVARTLRLERLEERLDTQLTQLQRQVAETRSRGGSNRRQRIEALGLKINDAAQRIAWCREELKHVDREPAGGNEVVIEVLQAIHPGARLLVGAYEMTPRRVIAGPFKLVTVEAALPRLAVSGAGRAVTDSMHVRARAA